MSFLTNFWNTAAEYFPGTAKYCKDNNINTVTLGNVAADLVFIGAGIGEKTAEAMQQAVHNASDAIVNSTATLQQWAGKAGTFAADNGYKALQGTHGWYFGKTAEENAQEGSAAMIKDLVVQVPQDVGYSLLKGTHDWYFEKTADAEPQGSATMAINLAGAAGSKLQDFGSSVLKGAYDWYFNTPAKDAADQDEPKGGDTPPTPAAGDTAAALAADLGMDKTNAPIPPSALPVANTSDDTAQQPPGAGVHVEELVLTSSLIQSPDDIVAADGFLNDQAGDDAILDAGDNRGYSSDENVTDIYFTDGFDILSTMNSHLTTSHAVSAY